MLIEYVAGVLALFDIFHSLDAVELDALFSADVCQFDIFFHDLTKVNDDGAECRR